VSFVDVTTRFNVRELTTSKIGELVRISGQVIRTHPIHPELVSGHFTCQDCQTDVPNVEQQFKVSYNFINNLNVYTIVQDKVILYSIIVHRNFLWICY